MLKLWKKKKKLSCLCLITSLLGCQNFPKIRPHLISIKDGVCVEYECSQDSCNTTCTLKKEWPLEHCDLFTALPPEDIAALKTYQKNVCTQ